LQGDRLSENASASFHAIDPLRDPRWSAFVAKHPRASIFHTVAWLDALRRTYGYEPIVYTTSPTGADLQNGVVFCRTESRITGRRLVSLPFSDYCEPLVESAEELRCILRSLQACQQSEHWKYVEIRPLSNLECSSAKNGFRPSRQYYLHTIDLQLPEDELFRQFHKSSIQYRVRKAEEVGLTYECGRSDSLLHKFYPMILTARRRHRVPPQPEEWFRNLATGLGDAFEIHVASHNNTVVAAIVTVRFKNTVLYKYGGSDHAYHRFGSVPFLLWRAIRKARSTGAQTFDLGRSDYLNQGLLTFKGRWASTRAVLTYWRFPGPAGGPAVDDSRVVRGAKCVFGLLPNSMLKVAGEILYRHIG
jgi:hypothetical protein